MPSGWALASERDVESNRSRVLPLLSQWCIARLANGRKISGAGYRNKIENAGRGESIGDQLIVKKPRPAAPAPAPVPAPALSGVARGVVGVGSSVTWTSSDADVSPGHVGEVLGTTEDERLRVKFPKGTWRFQRNQLVAAAAQPTSELAVQWKAQNLAAGRPDGEDYEHEPGPGLPDMEETTKMDQTQRKTGQRKRAPKAPLGDPPGNSQSQPAAAWPPPAGEQEPELERERSSLASSAVDRVAASHHSASSRLEHEGGGGLAIGGLAPPPRDSRRPWIRAQGLD